MKYSIIITIVCLFFLGNIIQATNKEAVLNAASLFVKQDSTLYKKLKLLKGKRKEEDIIKTLEIGYQLLDESIDEGEIEITIEVNSIMAEAFTKSRNYKKAIVFYKRALKLIGELGRYDEKSRKQLLKKLELIRYQTILQLGGTYHKLSLKGDLPIYRDSSMYFYNAIINDNSIINDEKLLRLKAKAFSNLSGIFSEDSKYKLAEEYANMAIEIHREQNNKMSESAALSNLANIFIYQESYKNAKDIYKQALKLIENDKSSTATQFKEALYENIAYSMYKLKDYKAYEVQTISYNLKDSLRDKEIRGMIEEIAYKYDFDKGKELGRKEEENKSLKNQRTFWAIGIGGFIIILSLLFWVNFYKLKQKNLRLKLSQSQLIQHQNLEKVRSEAQVRILNATIDGKETERKQIAETLHDSVSALLSSANLHLQATRSQLKGEVPIEIDKTQKIITEASQKIRDLSHTLVSSVLLKFGLKYAIKDMADKYSNSQIKIDTRIGETRRYHQNFEIKVYNIIQEFVNNILKHSKAEKAMIKLDEVNGKLSFKITDDGIGFDKTRITNKDGLGINQIEARIQMMQGEFNIDSVKKNGTVIKIVLPILEKEEVNLV